MIAKWFRWILEMISSWLYERTALLNQSHWFRFTVQCVNRLQTEFRLEASSHSRQRDFEEFYFRNQWFGEELTINYGKGALSNDKLFSSFGFSIPANQIISNSVNLFVFSFQNSTKDLSDPADGIFWGWDRKGTTVSITFCNNVMLLPLFIFLEMLYFIRKWWKRGWMRTIFPG